MNRPMKSTPSSVRRDRPRAFSSAALTKRTAPPVLLLTGWQDVFLDQTLEQYRHLRARDVDVALTIGPWTHDQMVTRATGVTAVETLQWLNAHLSDGRAAPRTSPVRLRLTRCPGRLNELPHRHHRPVSGSFTPTRAADSRPHRRRMTPRPRPSILTPPIPP